jgi:uncharacterized protein
MAEENVSQSNNCCLDNKNKCVCGDSCSCGRRKGKAIILVIGMIVLGAVIVVSILRERIVRDNQYQVTVTGQGKVSYRPDTAEIKIGVQIDKAPTAKDAFNQLNLKMGKIIEAVKAQGIAEDDIKTQNYSLNPQYDYLDGTSKVSGYNANQQLVVKIKNVTNNPDLIENVTSAANVAGANQILGIDFTIDDVNSFKQEARIKAIADAKAKAPAMFQAAGMPVGKIVGWYENILQSPDMQDGQRGWGLGGMEADKAAVPQPQIPSGTQEVIIEVGVNYEVK